MIFSTILAILKAIPALKSFFDELVTFYVNSEIDNFKQENKDAIIQAIIKHDQRAIEKALGSNTAGKPSGDAGSTVIDGPPPNVLPK